MSKFTAEDSATRLLFFLNNRNNFFVFFGMISNKRLKILHIQFIGCADPSLQLIFVQQGSFPV